MTASANGAPALGIQSFYQSKIQAYELLINDKTQNLRRLEAQRNALNARGELYRYCGADLHDMHERDTEAGLLSSATVRLLREELQLLQEPGSYVGEVVKVMGKKKVLVKVQPEGKYGKCAQYRLDSRPRDQGRINAQISLLALRRP